MNNESEIVMSMLCVPVICFIYYFRRDIKNLVAYKQLLISFFLFFLASIFTNIEQLIWYNYFNFLEHLCYLASVFFFLFWTIRYLISERGSTRYD